eukprot:4682511-Ditylum_brightwellii.AAC.1
MESETRAYPVQHRQRQLFSLHHRCLTGRTCADTFSSKRSVRGFTCCVQLFIVAIADYLWVKLLQRESQVPGRQEVPRHQPSEHDAPPLVPTPLSESESIGEENSRC